MKKSIYILFIFIYFFLNAGVVITAHFCKGNLKSIELLSEVEKKKCCKKECKAGCQDKVVDVKINDNQVFDFTKIFKNLQASLLPKINIVDEFVSNEFINIENNNFSPGSSTPIYLTNCILLI